MCKATKGGLYTNNRPCTSNRRSAQTFNRPAGCAGIGLPGSEPDTADDRLTHRQFQCLLSSRAGVGNERKVAAVAHLPCSQKVLVPCEVPGGQCWWSQLSDNLRWFA